MCQFGGLVLDFPNYSTRSGKNDRFASKVGFSPDLESTRLWERDFFKKGKPPLQRLQYRNMVAGFMLASHMCRFEDDLLLSSSLRLTHILLG